MSIEMDEVFAALGDPNRWKLLVLLAGLGDASATTLAERLPITRQAVIKHLGILDRAGLVTNHRTGREVRYAVRTEQLSATAQWLSHIATEWDTRLSAIKRLAECQDV